MQQFLGELLFLSFGSRAIYAANSINVEKFSLFHFKVYHAEKLIQSNIIYKNARHLDWARGNATLESRSAQKVQRCVSPQKAIAATS
jgi:hypothetical protein